MASGLQSIDNINHEYFMDIAIEEAIIAGERGDKPIAAVLVHNNNIIGKSSNTWNTRNSKVHHAENWLCMEYSNYLRKYGKECIIYSTLEPCIMCISTIIMADIRNIVVGYEDIYMKTWDNIQKLEWIFSRINNYKIGIRKEKCIDLIKRYGEEDDKKILLPE